MSRTPLAKIAAVFVLAVAVAVPVAAAQQASAVGTVGAGVHSDNMIWQ